MNGLPDILLEECMYAYMHINKCTLIILYAGIKCAMFFTLDYIMKSSHINTGRCL